MGLISIARADFDPATMLLHFAATASLGACRTTIISSIRMQRRPIGETAVRWAIMARLKQAVG